MERRAALKVLWVVFGVTIVGLGGIAAIVAAAPSRRTTPSGRQIALLAMSSSAPGSERYELAKAALDSIENAEYSVSPAGTAARADSERRSKDRVLDEQDGYFNRDMTAALAGDLSAARSMVGYHSEGFGHLPRNPLLACAWAMVVVNSGSASLDRSDARAQDDLCYRALSGSELQAAVAQSVTIEAGIRQRTRDR